MKELLMVLLLTYSTIACDIGGSFEYRVPDDIQTEVKVRTINAILAKYSKSTGFRETITKSIITVSKECGIDFSLLLASSIIESSAYPMQKHDEVHVLVYDKDGKKKRIHTRAIGMNGVIYDIHKNELNRIHIYSDVQLMYPLYSLRAMASIVFKYINMKMVHGSRSRIHSALMRYYGVIDTVKGYKTAFGYADKVLKVRDKIEKAYLVFSRDADIKLRASKIHISYLSIP